MERLYSQWAASPLEIKTLVLFALAELDRQRAALGNPTLAAMRAAVPDRLMADIINDQRRGVSAPSSLASTPGAPPPSEPVKGTGWVEPVVRDRTNEFALIDRMTEALAGGPNDPHMLRRRANIVSDQQAKGLPSEQPAANK
jgi:hypothetical protein